MVQKSEKLKLEGAYYTPSCLARYLVRITMNYFNDIDKIIVLEPSCGDGVFLKELLLSSSFIKKRGSIVCAVEKNIDELKKAKRYKKEFTSKGIKTSFVAEDYLNYACKRARKFDLIIGNPPYIHKNYLSHEQILKSESILNSVGINRESMVNIWIPFVIASLKLLKPNGVLCFVLPAEMLQVKYAEPVRKLLYQEFKEIRLYTFSYRVFEGIEQDVIVFVGKRTSQREIISHISLDKSRNSNLKIKDKNHLKKIYYQKWQWYLLTSDEIKLINSIQNKFLKIKDYCESTTGIVTGNNNYFILNVRQVNQHNLSNYAIPILKKSALINSTIVFTDEDFRRIEQNGEPCYLIDFNSLDIDNIPVDALNYIKLGELLGVNRGYKCRIRPQWYQVPSIWASEGIFFKRAHLYPKIIVNQANINVTDTAYRIKMKQGFSIESLVFCFYNSLTLLLSELEGRNYGGGVLEITPNEFKNIAIPYFEVDYELFYKLDRMFREEQSIDRILEFTDQVILSEKFGIEYSLIKKLRNIHKKLSAFRI